jgi:hypothetical protein
LIDEESSKAGINWKINGSSSWVASSNTTVSIVSRGAMTRLRLMTRSMSHKRWCRIAMPIDNGINRNARLVMATPTNS